MGFLCAAWGRGARMHWHGGMERAASMLKHSASRAVLHLRLQMLMHRWWLLSVLLPVSNCQARSANLAQAPSLSSDNHAGPVPTKLQKYALRRSTSRLGPTHTALCAPARAHHLLADPRHACARLVDAALLIHLRAHAPPAVVCACRVYAKGAPGL